MAKAKIISQGTDPKNGIITLSQKGESFIVTNSRKGLSIPCESLKEAQAEYDFQISDSHTQGQLKSLEAGPEAPPVDQDPAAPETTTPEPTEPTQPEPTKPEAE